MNGNVLLLVNEMWIKLNGMIVDLKSLKRGFQDETNWHEYGREYGVRPQHSTR